MKRHVAVPGRIPPVDVDGGGRNARMTGVLGTVLLVALVIEGVTLLGATGRRLPYGSFEEQTTATS